MNTLPYSSPDASIEDGIILLDRLLVSETRDGMLTESAAKIHRPTPCTQRNAPGSLREFESLEEYRAASREAGKGLKTALS